MYRQEYMDLAIKEAHKAFDKDEVPVGCLIVKDNKVLAKDKTRLIDLDLQDDRAEDSLNRKRRKDFYLRNGYYDINLRLDYLDMELELISSKQERPNLDEVTYILRNTIKDDLIVDYKELSND